MSPRVWRIGGLAAAALVLVVAWLLVVNPTMQSAAALQEEVIGQEQASDQLRSRISLLKKQSKELPAQEAILAKIQQRMPPTAALPTLIRNLTTVSENANVIVASVTPGKPNPISSEAPATSSTSDSATSSTSDSAATASSGARVEALSVNITACGAFAQLRNYLRELESMKRVMSVTSVSVARGSCAEGSADDDLTATIGAYVFTLPNAAPATTGVPAGPNESTEDGADE
jgi:Tfp pilus assembly protein PilO